MGLRLWLGGKVTMTGLGPAHWLRAATTQRDLWSGPRALDFPQNTKIFFFFLALWENFLKVCNLLSKGKSKEKK